jgi:UDP:flavonoid glycosyltransferase YjiC (YdhE family)
VVTVRILVTARPALGHVAPMLPLVAAATAAGHEVRLATGPDLVAEVAARGIPTLAVGPTFPGALETFAASGTGDVADVLTAERFPFLGRHLFGATARARLDDLRVAVRDWRPDLVVSELTEPAGLVLAADLGAPAVVHGFGIPLPGVAAFAAAVLDGVGRPDLVGPCWDWPYVDIAPASLRPEPSLPWRTVLPSRPTSEVPAEAVLPASVLGLLDRGAGGRPLVYVTLGTVFNTVPGLLGQLVEAVRDLHCSVVATTGPGVDPSSLGAQPGHVVVTDFVAQGLLLPHVDLVVSQCGAGGLLGALAHGVPQVCVPLGADQFPNAAAVERVGAGVVVPPDARSPAEVRRAAAAVLADPNRRQAASRVADEIAVMPAAASVLTAVLAGAGSEG